MGPSATPLHRVAPDGTSTPLFPDSEGEAQHIILSALVPGPSLCAVAVVHQQCSADWHALHLAAIRYRLLALSFPPRRRRSLRQTLSLAERFMASDTCHHNTVRCSILSLAARLTGE